MQQGSIYQRTVKHVLHVQQVIIVQAVPLHTQAVSRDLQVNVRLERTAVVLKRRVPHVNKVLIITQLVPVHVPHVKMEQQPTVPAKPVVTQRVRMRQIPRHGRRRPGHLEILIISS